MKIHIMFFSLMDALVVLVNCCARYLCLLSVFNYRPGVPVDDDSDSDDSNACGQLVIDISLEEGEGAAPKYSPISSVGDEVVAGNLPTGDGVFSPFSPVSAGTSYSVRSMSLSAGVASGCAMNTVDEQFARLAEMDVGDLEREIEELCGDKDLSPCIRLTAPSEPASRLEPVTGPAAEAAPVVESADVRPLDPVGVTFSRRTSEATSSPGDRRVVVCRSPVRFEDPSQDQYLMILLDARGQMPSRKRKSPCI